MTSVIIGPRTQEQLDAMLKGASLLLDDETLDRIDQIVPPGVDHYDVTSLATRPSLANALHRRRAVTDRPAASK